MQDFPAHASPKIVPIHTPPPRSVRALSDLSDLDIAEEHKHAQLHHSHGHDHTSHQNGAPPPPSLISPAITPPATPGTLTPKTLQLRPARSILVDSSTSSHPGPKLLENLPTVNCVVRARIPTTNGQEMFLHLYTNDMDQKEHLAIVFGPHIRSRSLDRVKEGESEMDRMIRGAYTGRLYPGRISSRPEERQSQASGLQKRIQKKGIPMRKNLEDMEEHKREESTSSHEDGVPSAEFNDEDDNEHNDPFANAPPLVRIHSECYTGETVWSARCDCGEQLDEAARLMSLPLHSATPDSPSSPNPGGVIIYLRQEGRGIGLSEKLKAYNLQDLGSDTVEANLLLRHPADARSYGLATAMLVDLGLGGERGIRLLTNNPDKVRAVEGPEKEIRVRERVAMVPLAWKTGGKEGVKGKEVENYLRTKIERMSHLLQMDQA